MEEEKGVKGYPWGARYALWGNCHRQTQLTSEGLNQSMSSSVYSYLLEFLRGYNLSALCGIMNDSV